MGQLVQVRHKGLYTSPNEFSAVPAGAMIRGNNAVIDDENILHPRRGNERTVALPLAGDRAGRFEFYQEKQIGTWSGGKVGYLDGTWTAYTGTYNHPNATFARTRFLQTSNNLYFTSDSGVYKLDAYDSTPVLAGMYKGLDIEVALSGSSGFLATANQAAYRVVWGIKDANDNIILGAPSGRAVISNSTGGSRDVDLDITIPDGITTEHFFQVYRSAPSGGAAVEPNDELGLVYENNPTAGEITAKVVSFTDNTPDDLRGATIYTAPSQQGIFQANDRPPLCEDFTEFQDSVIYANVESLQRLQLTLLAVGTGAVSSGDVLTIAGTTYTGASSEDIAAREFAVVTSGTPAQNITDTAVSLIRVINRNTTNTSVYAYYLSGPADLPGQILLESRSLGAASFSVTVDTHGSSWNPVLPTSGTTVASSKDDFQNVAMISKTDLGEAVPLVNTRRVGSRNNPIRRVVGLRNSCFFLKQNEPIYRMTGTSPSNFEVDEFDKSAKLIAPDSVAVVNNEIWCLTDQGVTVITETGVSVVSRPIEDLILDQFGTALDQVKQYSWGVGYETDRKYILHTVSSSGDTYTTQAFVFNTFTKAFTRWPVAKSCGAVNPADDKLYFGDALSSWTEKERKTRTYTDSVDYGTTYTIASSSGMNVFLTSTNEVEVGDVLYQSASVQSVITAVEPAFVTVRDTVTWANGDVTVLKAFEVEVEYAAIHGDNPGIVHQFPEIAALFRKARFNTATLAFATDMSGYYEDVEIAGSRTGLWGLFPWGTEPWGGNAVSVPIRTLVPLEKQYGTWLRLRFKIRQGYSQWALNGFSIPFEDTDSTVVAK